MPEKQFTWDQLRDAIWDELKESEFVGDDNNRAHIIIGIVGAAVDRLQAHPSQSSIPYQKCSKCDGQGTVSKPPYIPGDVHEWSTTSVTHVCDVCHGAKVIPMYVPQGAVWVRASDRLPDGHAANYHWRFSHSKKPIVCVFHIALGTLVMEYSNTRARYNFDQVEWQDESGAAAGDGKEEITDHEHEKEVMMQAFDKVRQIFESRSWIMEGRGSYPYNDDRYKEEVRYLYDEVDALFKSTWAQIKSKTFEYRNKIIEQNKKEAGKNTHPTIDELWDEHSELIEDNIDDLTRWAGSTVMVKSAFEKAVAKIGGDAGKEEAFFIVIEWLRKTIFKGDERING